MTEAVPVLDVELLKQIAESTSNDLILFFVILALVAVPLLVVLQRGNAKRREQDAEREQNLITVIQSNTEAMSGVKHSLDLFVATMQEEPEGAT